MLTWALVALAAEPSRLRATDPGIARVVPPATPLDRLIAPAMVRALGLVALLKIGRAHV